MRSILTMTLISLGIGLGLTALLSGHERTLLLLAQAACLLLIWITGIRALLLWLRSRAKAPALPAPGYPTRVTLLYCTADDLNLAALTASAAQDAPVEVCLLDDSSTETARAAVDAAAARIGARVLRREQRVDAKAGNLNHALTALGDSADAVVVLDSDTVLPADFVRRAAVVLASDPRIACVQAVPSAGGSSRFARFFGPLTRTHARINQATRSRIGFPAFLGRGALLRLSALREVGGFPPAVAEDLALSVRLRERGHRIVHRPDLEFTEDYPLDYAAFRVQQGKTAEGAAEFLLSDRGRALPPRERRDLLLETALLPFGAAAGLGALAFGGALALWGHPTPVALSLATALFALAPLLPEAVRRLRHGHPLSALAFLALTPLLYASASLLILRRAADVLQGRKARFAVTPKEATRLTPTEAIGSLRAEYGWAIVALVVAISLGMPLLALPFTMPALAGTAFLLLGARSGAGLLFPLPGAPVCA